MRLYLLNLISLFILTSGLVGIPTMSAFASPLVALFAMPPAAAARTTAKVLSLSSAIYKTTTMPFVEHENALALNIDYAPILSLRGQIEQNLHIKLKWFQGWSKDGEAHVTVVTPIETPVLIAGKVTQTRIDQIAGDLKIQESDLQIVGMGHGEAKVDGKLESTLFVIVKSKNLLKIRQAIEAEFLKGGGKPGTFKAEHFFPHITVGFTLRDLHENDGVIKDAGHSLDKRFEIQIDP